MKSASLVYNESNSVVLPLAPSNANKSSIWEAGAAVLARAEEMPT
jgi:hypothetical protein